MSPLPPLPPLLLLLSLLLLTPTLMVQGFMTHSPAVLALLPHRLGKKLTTKSSLCYSFTSDDNSITDFLDDYDRARKEFSELVRDHNIFQQDEQNDSSTKNNNLPRHDHNLNQLIDDDDDDEYSDFDLNYSPSPLTATDYMRRQMEIGFLQSLKNSDDAIKELMNMWLLERDYESGQKLKKLTEDCSPGSVEEAQALRQILLEHGPEWVEPMSRLAAVLYYQGKTQQAKKWCQLALTLKPWHFEVGNTAVLLSLREQEPTGETLKIARRYKLPPLNSRTNNKRRIEWVNWAVQHAKQSLQHAEQYAKDYFTSASECPVDDGDVPCWQK